MRKAMFFKTQSISYPIDAFVFTISNTATFTIPTKGGETYNYNISTSDGQLFTNVTGDQTINFPSSDDYTISITGIFPVIYFNGSSSSRGFMRDILQWGNPNWGIDHSNAFEDCTFLSCTAIDSPFSQVEVADEMFRRCSTNFSLNNEMNFSNIRSARSMFRETTFKNLLNHEFANLEVGESMFLQVTGTIQVNNFNPASITNGPFPSGMSNAFLNGVVPTDDYSNILIRAEANNPNNNVAFNSFQNSKYNSTAITARANLISRGWVLDDAGLE